ncbi:MAG: L-serine ammonia-lyase, iron-sulfur-dependent, subunit alpha [Bacilli bacterium]|nr:L-serine ammonia-lyase, iron-sulfur-dependent, subunit alpha [Bacilli bacterium]
MKSLSKLFRYGPGPSSSHTIAPSNAARSFKTLIAGREVDKIVVTLYASLAATGAGHNTDKIIIKVLEPYPCEVIFDKKTIVKHPLTFSFEAFYQGKSIKKATYASLGGGEVTSEDDPSVRESDIYPFKTFKEIVSFMRKNKVSSFKEFCLEFEDNSIDEYLSSALQKMFESVERGLQSDDYIPANNNPKLRWKRSAKTILQSGLSHKNVEFERQIKLTSYAYAVAEGSASGEEIVTAPTCGSSGVLPSILYYLYHDEKVPFEKLKDSLYLAGIIGNIVKQNASIAGAIGGCQAEIGTASCMAAAALSEIEGLSIYQIEYAAEVAMEHFLGLSCDPVDGYVIIPCIERNAIGSLRAFSAFLFAKIIAPIRRNQVSFDDVVDAMKLTGDSLASAYKETSEGGLAKILSKKN